MKIVELIVEDQTTDEGVLGAIGRGAAAVGGGIAKGAGMIAGIPQGMKAAFQKGKATSAAHIAGDVPKPAADTSVYDKEYARLTQPQQAAAPASGAPQAAPAASAAAPDELDAIKRNAGVSTAPDPATAARIAAAPQGYDGETGKPNPAPAAGKPDELGRIEPTMGGNTPPAGSPPAADPATVAKQDQQSKVGVGQINKIIPTLRTRDLNSVKKTVDATIAKKGSGAAQTAAPAADAAPNLQVQTGGKPKKAAAPTPAELAADQERMASGTNESKSVKFYSRFLGTEI